MGRAWPWKRLPWVGNWRLHSPTCCYSDITTEMKCFHVVQLFFSIRITFIYCFVRLHTRFWILNGYLLLRFDPFRNEGGDTNLISALQALFRPLSSLLHAPVYLFQPMENFCEFIWVYLSQMHNMPGSKISVALEKDSFAVPFIHLELGSEQKEDGREVGASSLGEIRGGPAGQLTRLHAPQGWAHLSSACKRSSLGISKVCNLGAEEGWTGLA